jgi:hypothetical protein
MIIPKQIERMMFFMFDIFQNRYEITGINFIFHRKGAKPQKNEP